MASRSRPALGDNTNRAYNRPKPAYKSDSAPKVVGRGTVDRPKPLPKYRPGTLVTDATPKVVSL